MATYRCNEDADHIVKIAAEKGYFDWKTIWDANSSLKSSKKRGNPLLLFKGDELAPSDQLELPEKKNQGESQGTESHQVYVVPQAKLCLRLRILKGDFTPIKDASFELKVDGGQTFKGKTDANGRVLVTGKDPTLHDKAVAATLAVRLTPEDGQGGGSTAQQSGENALASDVPVVWNLRIGKLNPIMEKAPTDRCMSGVQQRLNNLGFNSGRIDGILGPKTRAATEAFQSLFKLEVDGIAGQGETQPKLVEVYDRGTFTGPPPGSLPSSKRKRGTAAGDDEVMVADEGGNIKVEKKEPEPLDPAHIGHVAPDFVDGSPPFINTLVIRPTYRISLDLGSIESLFLHKPNTDRGRMERLQVAGLFYFPMHHKKAEEAGKFAWKYYTETLGGSEKALRERIDTWVIPDGKLPKPAPEGQTPTKDNFTKIRVPGGYSYIYEDDRPFHPNHDTDYPLYMRTGSLNKCQVMCYADNPALGSIPLIARVEMRYGASGEWRAAKDVMVYFQLVKPYDLPAYDPSVAPHKQINCPPLRDSNMQSNTASGVGPRKHVDAALKHSEDANDPQVNNCHKDFGGKRGLPVADNVFEIKVDLAKYKEVTAGTKKKEKRPGFHDAHTGERAGDVHPPFFELPEEAPADGEKHKHAVRAKTNDNGTAGVIFRPSAMGGDRYRIRAYIGPDTMPSDGTGTDAVMVETGTFVVWRNMRISQVLKMPYKDMSADMKSEVRNEAMHLVGGMVHPLIQKPLETLQKRTGVIKNDASDVGYSTVDLSEMGDSNCAYPGYRKEMAHAFYEVDLDPGADTARDLTNDEWWAALDAAAAQAEAKKTLTAGGKTLTVNVNKLFIRDRSKVSVTTSHVLVPMRYPKAYNDSLPGSSPDKINLKSSGMLNDPGGKWDSWFDNNIIHTFMHTLASKGYLPGLTMLQMPTISTWHALGHLSDYSIGLGYRCCIMRGGKDLYPYGTRQPAAKTLTRDGMTQKLDDYGYSALAVHEWGHNLFQVHAPPDPAPGSTAIHDDQNDGYCIMTYLPNEGDFCGKCICNLRGWTNISSLP